jgi:hypothetical protein
MGSSPNDKVSQVSNIGNHLRKIMLERIDMSVFGWKDVGSTLFFSRRTTARIQHHPMSGSMRPVFGFTLW